ncbi:hypothetical protein HHK36_019756 [Tetracentron sinense]|uniref:RNase H type-1 domain-containing protein n=1 Tax=Tetracentron sinense TaxID=13715 RepID=A0A834YWY9_TETSI|nr:hypothetical protein HHK36_019756 [Tetracentron sinense]
MGKGKGGPGTTRSISVGNEGAALREVAGLLVTSMVASWDVLGLQGTCEIVGIRGGSQMVGEANRGAAGWSQIGKEEVVAMGDAAGLDIEGALATTFGRGKTEVVGNRAGKTVDDESIWRCLDDVSRDESKFVMHDLINDLAGYVAGEICFRLEDRLQGNMTYDVPKMARHSSYVGHTYDRKTIFEAFIEVKCLRTFLALDLMRDGRASSYRYLPIQAPQCENLKDLPVGMVHSNTSLQYLKIDECSSLTAFPKGGLPTSLEHLLVSNCTNLESLPEGMHNNMYLKHLEILECHSLTSFPEGLHKLTSLNELIIKGCPHLMSFPEGGLPTMLKGMEIQDCWNIESLLKGLCNLTFLDRLEIRGYTDLVSFPEGGLFPNTLRSLLICEFDNLQSLPNWICDLTSLQDLEIQGCHSLVSFPEAGLLTSLKKLHIIGCRGFVSFPECLLPTNLTSLRIKQCPDLKSLPKRLQKLTSLEYLEISECNKLASLPAVANYSGFARQIFDHCSILVLHVEDKTIKLQCGCALLRFDTCELHMGRQSMYKRPVLSVGIAWGLNTDFSPKPLICIKWHPPEEGTICLNIAGVSSDSRSGWGCLFRDFKGTASFAVAGACSPLSSLLAELEAALRGLLFARDAGIRHLIVLTSSQTVVGCLSGVREEVRASGKGYLVTVKVLGLKIPAMPLVCMEWVGTNDVLGGGACVGIGEDGEPGEVRGDGSIRWGMDGLGDEFGRE